MFKFATVGAFDRAINVPYCVLDTTVTGKVYNGNAVTILRKDKKLTPASNFASGELGVIYNEYRTFDYDKFDDMSFEAGDRPLVFTVDSLVGNEVEFTIDANIMTNAAAAVTAGTTLYYDANGKLGTTKGTHLLGYYVLEVRGKWVRAQVVKAAPTT